VSLSIALPRVRAKRKRRKPPRPEFWRAFRWVLWDVAFAVWDLVAIGWARWPVAMACFAAVMIVDFAVFSWPRFRRELDLWREDDDS
jgi:hypothetical protein